MDQNETSKGIVHPKRNILSWFIHRHVIQTMPSWFCCLVQFSITVRSNALLSFVGSCRAASGEVWHSKYHLLCSAEERQSYRVWRWAMKDFLVISLWFLTSCPITRENRHVWPPYVTTVRIWCKKSPLAFHCFHFKPLTVIAIVALLVFGTLWLLSVGCPQNVLATLGEKNGSIQPMHDQARLYSSYIT